MKIAIAGLGTVGAGLVKLLGDNAAEITARAGEVVEITAVSARNKSKNRGVDFSKTKWVDNPLDLVKTEADIIVELIGGDSGPAVELVRAALNGKKHVVTANKAMMAHHGAELAALAEKNGVQLRYEAAVAGGIPVIKALREGVAANKITRVSGILNGTCNYILTQMETRRNEFPAILQEAQEKGYAESDPSFDVEGIDAAHKLVILAACAFGVQPDFEQVYVEGIDKIKLADLDFAKKLGYRVKHLCFAALRDGGVELRAHACLLPQAHSLANINDVFNAIEIEGEPVGKVVLSGRGAGAGPTSSAVASDIIDIAKGRFVNPFIIPTAKLGELKALAIGEISSSFYLRLVVEDRPGVLEEITAVFKEEGLSINKFFQDETSGGTAQVIIITHPTKEKFFRVAVAKLAKLSSVKEEPQIIRILP